MKFLATGSSTQTGNYFSFNVCYGLLRAAMIAVTLPLFGPVEQVLLLTISVDARHSMKPGKMIAVIVVVICMLSIGAFGDQWVLSDWAVIVDGTTYNSMLPPNINSSAFDFVMGIGSLTFSVADPGNHFVGVYFNHDRESSAFASYGTVVGTPPTGLTWELNAPSNVWTDFANNALDNANHVATYSPLPNACCNVAEGEIQAFTLAANERATVHFDVSTALPLNSFYLRVTDDPSGESLYIGENFNVTSFAQVPEPYSLALVITGLIVWRCRVPRSSLPSA